jgi:hypothetical protein
MRYPMNTGGTRLNRLLMGGLMAGALGLVHAAQPPDYRGDAGTLGSGSAQTTPYDTAPGASSPTSGGPTLDTSFTGSVSNATGNLPPNVTPGWKIRVCSERTKVDNLTFRISQPEKSDRSGKAMGKPYGSKTTAEQAEAQQGTPGMAAENAGAENAGIVQQTAIWSRGAASEIPVPTALREADRIRIEAVGQKDKDAHVCVLYNDHVARKMNFDEREVATLRKTENGECGC